MEGEITRLTLMFVSEACILSVKPLVTINAYTSHSGFQAGPEWVLEPVALIHQTHGHAGEFSHLKMNLWPREAGNKFITL